MSQSSCPKCAVNEGKLHALLDVRVCASQQADDKPVAEKIDRPMPLPARWTAVQSFQ